MSFPFSMDVKVEERSLFLLILIVRLRCVLSRLLTFSYCKSVLRNWKAGQDMADDLIIIYSVPCRKTGLQGRGSWEEAHFRYS